jgi:signal-transduction protein with cAMP-binding, CBS, and nucleotidyltransferase domain
VHNVADLLEERKSEAVVWIEPLASVYDALKMMNERNVGALLVQIDDYLVGIVSERDYVRKVILDSHASKTTKVSQIMTRDVVTVTREDTVVHCVALMRKHHVRHLPVVEKGRAVGMISLRDLFLDVIHEKFAEHGVTEEEI